jgi:hypothetical protein
VRFAMCGSCAGECEDGEDRSGKHFGGESRMRISSARSRKMSGAVFVPSYTSRTFPHVPRSYSHKQPTLICTFLSRFPAPWKRKVVCKQAILAPRTNDFYQVLQSHQVPLLSSVVWCGVAPMVTLCGASYSLCPACEPLGNVLTEQVSGLGDKWLAQPIAVSMGALRRAHVRNMTILSNSDWLG